MSELTESSAVRSNKNMLHNARHLLGSPSRRLSTMIRRPLSLVRRPAVGHAESSSCGSDNDDTHDPHADHQTHSHQALVSTSAPRQAHVSTAKVQTSLVIVSTSPNATSTETPLSSPGSPPIQPADATLQIDSPATLDPTTTTVRANTAAGTTGAAHTAPHSSINPPAPGLPTCKLLSLPQELFDMITKHLSPAGLVILALVNKDLFAMFTRSVTAAQPQLVPAPDKSPWTILNNFIKDADRTRSRFRGILLSTLDMDYINLVYCYKCRRMHDPFVAFKDRLYAPRKSTKCVDYEADSHIPPRATRKMLRAITKYRNRHANHLPLLQQVNNTSTTCKNGNVVQISLNMRYRRDNMLLRRQQVVASMDKNPRNIFMMRMQLLRASRTDMQALKGVPPVQRPCNHMSWLAKYNKVFDDLMSHLCLGACTSDNVPAIEHKPTCFSADARDLSKERGNAIFDRLSTPRKCHYPLGTDQGCDRCTTDMHIDIIRLPEPYYWGFVLTTWIDVGKIDLSKKWDSHRPDAGPHRDYPRHGEPIGSICRQFEGLERDAIYVPVMSDLNKERLTNFGWMKEAAKQGPGSQIQNWSLEHAIDPATGMILNPDPLTKADY